MRISFYLLVAMLFKMNSSEVLANSPAIGLVNNTTIYKIADTNSFCNVSSFCQPILVLLPIDNIVGFNFEINFDPTKVVPTGNVTVSNDLINGGYVEVFSSIDLINGTMNVFLILNVTAPSTAEFSGVGNLCCIEFNKKPAFICNTTTPFTIDVMEENYFAGIVEEPVIPGSHANDNVPPMVNITAPIMNSLFNFSNLVTIEANASDADGAISLVEFYVDEIKVGEDATSPYSYSLSNLQAGYRELKAKATDNLGATSFSTIIDIYINNPPIVTIVAPLNNSISYRPSLLTIHSDAIDIDSGEVILVEFFNNTVKIGEDAIFPYSFDLLNPPIGIYNFTAKASDQFGAISTSLSVLVNVKCYREDLDDNGSINVTDLLMFLSLFNTTCNGCRADFTADGLISTNDLLLLISKFGLNCN